MISYSNKVVRHLKMTKSRIGEIFATHLSKGSSSLYLRILKDLFLKYCKSSRYLRSEVRLSQANFSSECSHCPCFWFHFHVLPEGGLGRGRRKNSAMVRGRKTGKKRRHMHIYAQEKYWIKIY